ncbi:hypothetical protein [Pedobacter glucosidilyticus]|uniref:hypothetical protein n=1 Tax=Pedobacter glucosidilyticus TaxID=1122941 RepID=UPI0026EA893C|nr:hypothetical protein [Pedobacter glucosidilyticus]
MLITPFQKAVQHRVQLIPILLLTITMVLFSCKKTAPTEDKKLVIKDLFVEREPYNFILGTHAISGSYQFTTNVSLIEQAQKVREMGSNILKISLGKDATSIYKINETFPSKTTLELFSNNAAYKIACDMDFKYIFLWVHTLTNVDWKSTISPKNEKILYDEMYKFATYLLNRYDNSGKTFFIGNWEGDWLLIPNYDASVTPSAASLNNMAKWFQIRQRAIDDAKAASTSKNVYMYHYIEANLVKKGMNGQPCVAQSVIPQVNVDLISYSSYESIKGPNYDAKKNDLTAAFNYLESKLQPKPSLPFSKRVFIGEYGFQADATRPTTLQQQFNQSKEIMKIAFELNLPFALHWQMYNNEYDNITKASKNMSLINEQGEKTRLYSLHQDFYQKMNAYLKEEKLKNNTYPTSEQFRTKAIEVLSTLTF